MIDPSTAQTVYNDMGALADLRSRARANPNEAVEEVAQQFEALFIQMMLKSMRDAVEDGGLFGSDQLDTYQQMADQQTALDMAAKGGIGLAEALWRSCRAMSPWDDRYRWSPCIEGRGLFAGAGCGPV